MPTETWREIRIAPGVEVSDLGRVRTYWTRAGAPQRKTVVGSIPVVAIPRVDRHGYESIRVRVDSGVYRRVFVHRLVADAFLGSIPQGAEINHLDGNKRNNRSDNLEFSSRQENAKHAARLGLYCSGERNPAAKLTEAQVREAPVLRAGGMTITAIAARYAVAPSTVSRVLAGRRWKGRK